MDYVNDHSGRHLLRLDKSGADVPDFVKQASVDEDAVAGLPSHVFADPVRREFPLDCPGHAYLAYAYCKSACVQDAKVLNRVKEAMRLFGLTEHQVKLDVALDIPAEKSASTRRFACQLDFGDPDPTAEFSAKKQGGIQGFYPINSTDEVEASAIKLSNHKNRIPLPLFVEGARAVVKAAHDFGMPLRMIPTTILSYGEMRNPNLTVLEQEAEKRATKTGDDIYLDLYKTASADPENLSSDAYAELWYMADRKNSVSYYDRTMDPYLIFGSGEKVASADEAINNWTVIGKAPVPLRAVANLQEPTIRKSFSKAAADTLMAIVKQASTSRGPDITQSIARLDQRLQNALLRLIVAT